jgi:hypothetical protein
MVGGVVTLLHPGIDVGAALDLPFVDVWDMPEGFELLGDPECPIAICGSIADENIGHRLCAHSIGRGRASWLPVSQRATAMNRSWEEQHQQPARPQRAPRSANPVPPRITGAGSRAARDHAPPTIR